MSSELHAIEVAKGERFEFGENWARFLESLSEERILAAERSLKMMLRMDSLEGKTFLDAGSGSGLFSLAAKRLGARVTSFDFDPASVRCTSSIKERFFGEDESWTVHQGSVLDEEFVNGLGQFDIVYSWGVLHHTGSMNQAIANVSRSVGDGGLFFIAIYNDQGWLSAYWTAIKKLYNTGKVGRVVATAIPLPYFLAHRAFRILVPKKTPRGMDWWRDVLDWVGGYPFEVATPQAIVDFCYDLGFSLVKQKTVKNKHGCNEFVLQRLNNNG
jgi:2-polyprenyl-6-hydroxyphenyl methylase/3-demethylubiquinone-9 3-methyltransferase